MADELRVLELDNGGADPVCAGGEVDDGTHDKGVAAVMPAPLAVALGGLLAPAAHGGVDGFCSITVAGVVGTKVGDDIAEELVAIAG